MLVAFVCYCMFLDCESLIHVNFIPLFVVHVWHPRFHLYGIKKVFDLNIHVPCYAIIKKCY